MEEYNILNIQNSVNNYKNLQTSRFHMPGHKGRSVGNFLDAVYPYDVTEIDATDNLFAPHTNGTIENDYAAARAIYGTANTIYSAAGATAALQTALMLCVLRADSGTPKIMCGRQVHKSVVNAMALLGVEPIWFDPHDADNFSPSNDICAILVTSPDYYGQMCDIKQLSDTAHSAGKPLICDNSHGAHLAFCDGGRLHAYKNGVDLCVDSLHKTTPALTGAAVLHMNENFDRDTAIWAMSVFASTSPSYLIMSSIDSAIDYMAKNGEQKLKELGENIEHTKRKLHKLGYETAEFPLPDPYRLCIRDARANELYEFLYERGVVCEFSDFSNVVLIPSVMSDTVDFMRLTDACAEFCPKHTDDTAYNFSFGYPKAGISLRRALLSAKKWTDTDCAYGEIAADMVTPYPPGIPIIMPGEIFDAKTIDLIKKYNIKKVKTVDNKFQPIKI